MYLVIDILLELDSEPRKGTRSSGMGKIVIVVYSEDHASTLTHFIFKAWKIRGKSCTYIVVIKEDIPPSPSRSGEKPRWKRQESQGYATGTNGQERQ